MADRWWGYITIEKFPIDWLHVSERAGYGGGTYKEYGLDEATIIGEEPDETEAFATATSPDYVAAVERYEARQSLVRAIREFQFETFEFTPEVEEGETPLTGELRLSDSQLAGGSWAIFEDSELPGLLETLGFAFHGGDDGDYGNPGMYYYWRPGMDGIETRTSAAETGIVLSEHELRSLWTDDVDELRRRLREHFDLAADDPLTPRGVTA